MIFGESGSGENVRPLLAKPPTPLPYSFAIFESEQALPSRDGKTNYQYVSAHLDAQGFNTCDRLSQRWQHQQRHNTILSRRIDKNLFWDC